MANRLRFHQFRAGLYVPFTAADFRIYDLSLRDVWGPALVAGARPLRGKARLLVPWRGGAAQLTLLGRGKGQLVVDGQRRPLKLAAGAEPGTQVLALGELAAGEHELIFEPRGSLSLRSLELAAPGAAGCPGEARAGAADQLSGARELEMVVELPAQARLAFSVEGGGPAAVAVRGEDGARRVLWQGPADGRAHVVPLARARAARAVGSACGSTPARRRRRCAASRPPSTWS
jgi:hypothetical protein